MSTYSKPFADRLARLLKKHGLSKTGAAPFCKFAASKTSFQNWLDGQLPMEVSLRRVLAHFPAENADDWVSEFYRDQQVAA